MESKLTGNITLQRKIFATNQEMGGTAGKEVGEALREYTVRKNLPVVANFAAAPSQDTFLAQLSKEEGIDWEKVTAVHLDEYVDLDKGHPNTFQVYLEEHLFDNIPIPREKVHYIKDLRGSPQEIATEYDQLIRKVVEETRDRGGIYIACIGIGVNGHIAFNEPHVDKRTKRIVIPVEIDETSVKQQYDDYKDHPNPQARYQTLEDVPQRAITVSCAGILAADRIFCMVPGAQKADAVKAMWDGPITDKLPASLLRLHHQVVLYLDRASASKLDRKLVVE